MTMHDSVDKRVLASIKDGMKVIDSEGEEIGVVEHVYFGEDDEAATVEDTGYQENTFVRWIADAFTGETRIPDELRKRLLMSGFVRIDGHGLFAADRFVMPDNIARVHDNHVHLSVPRKALVKE